MSKYLVLFALLINSSVKALELDWLPTAQISFRPAYQISNQPITDPQGDLLNYTDTHGRLYGLFKLQKSFADLKLISQLRPRLDYTNKDIRLNAGLDELYLDYTLTKAVFLSVGKRNVFTGVGLGTNPTDYFGENKTIDNSLNREALRDQRKGDYMVSADWFLESASWSLFFAPRMGTLQQPQSRLLLRYNQLFEKFNSDFSGFLFVGERPGLGMNLSKTMTDNWVMYTELSLRKGRDRFIENITQQNSNKIVVDALLGANYTFNNGLNFILEYWHKGSGYDNKEWKVLNNLTSISSSQLNTANHAQGIVNLVQINQGLIPNYLRQNYLFSRFSYSNNWLGDLSLVHLFNLDDSSQFIRAAIEKEFASQYMVGLQVEQMLGQKDEEFGMRPWSTNITMTFRVSFN
jgi:hypothetical protein